MKRVRVTTAAARRTAECAATRLAANPRVQLVYLFGSAADPARDTARDVDLAVLTTPALSLDELVHLRADLMSTAQGEIDLVSLNDAPVVLMHEIADSGRCLFTRTPGVEVDFVTRARARYWDFKPFLDAQWRLTGKRLVKRKHGATP